MGKLKNSIRPYTFRGRLLAALMISCLFSAVVSLLLAYIFSHMSIQSEIEDNQKSTAINLLVMDQKTDLHAEQLLEVAKNGSQTAILISEDDEVLTGEIRELLTENTMVTLFDDLTSMPVTLVQLEEGIVLITPARDFNLYWSAFFRIVFAAVSFLTVFAAMATLASFKVSKPIGELTKATQIVKKGDFSVKLEENIPGEIGELNKSFNSMTDALARTAYLQKDFISSVSHEFRTPIASIKGFTHLLQMPGVTQDQKVEYVQFIAHESDRLSRLSETLLRLTALEQQKGPAEISRFHIDEQIRQVILRLEPAWSQRNIDWQLELSDVECESDEALLWHVWTNLIQNAVKFSPDNGVITIRVYKTDCAVFEITDQGPGMTPEMINRIFDRFYQGDTSRSKEGVGLGLCLVKRILDMLGGTVKVRSVSGEGSTFLVYLPLTPKQHSKGDSKNDRS